MTVSDSAVLAFDVGGTDIKAGILQGPLGPEPPRILGLRRLPTPQDEGGSGQAVVDLIADLTEAYRLTYPDVGIAALGLTVPGLVDETSGTGLLSANLGWARFPFTRLVAGRTGLPVAFGHDVGTAGEAEFLIGAARGATDAIVVVIGTGIAGAVFSDGRRILGGGYAGELGHVLVPGPDGSLQILESIASAGAIVRRFQTATGRTMDGAREVVALALAGDPVGQRIWTEAVDALAFGLAQCVSVLGTETIVLGGGLAEAGDALIDPLVRRMDELLTFHRRPAIMRAKLGQNAGLIGAALKAHRLLDVAEGPS